MTPSQDPRNAISSLAGALESRAARLMAADSPGAYRLGLAGLVLLAVVACGLIVATGAAHQRIRAWDSIALLDGGWRIVCGQRPHVDFYDHLGVTCSLSTAVGMWLGGCRGSALAYGAAALLPVVALASWWLARRRLSAAPALWFSAMAACLVIGPFPLGYSAGWRMPGYAMQYNRFAWALLMLLSLAALLPPRRRDSWRQECGEGLILGIIAAALLFGKVNYAGIAFLTLAAGALLHRGSWRRWIALLAGITLVTAAWLVYLRGDWMSWLGDMRMVAGVNSHLSDRIGNMGALLFNSVGFFGVLALALLSQLQPMLSGGRSKPLPAVWCKGLLAAALCVVVGLMATAGNAQDYDVPLFAVAGLLLAESFGRAMARAADAPPPAETERTAGGASRLLFGHLLAACIGVTFIVPDVAGLAGSWFWKRYRAPQAPVTARIAAAPLDDLWFPPEGGEPADATRPLPIGANRRGGENLTSFEFVRVVNDGLELLREQVNQDSRIVVFDSCNPFPMALGLPSAKGAPLFTNYGRVLDEAHRPAAERFFAEATHVMIPKCPVARPTAGFLERTYGPYVRAHFRRGGESDLWTLYIRGIPGRSGF